MEMSVEREASTFVATVRGLDVKRMDAPQRHALRRIWLEHKVLRIPDQDLDAAEVAGFSKLFGETVEHPVKNFLHPQYPEVMILSNSTRLGKPVGVRDAGSFWHSDRSYMERTADATILYSVEIPDVGGDTHFADLEAIYDSLAPGLKRRIAGRTWLSHYRWSADRDDPYSRWQMLTGQERANTPEVVRPVVRTHPETGRKSLFVFPGVSAGAKCIIGMDPDESAELLNRLFGHMLQERFQYRLRWDGPGTIVLWDNRCVMHKATTDRLPADKTRTLYRVSTLGSVPY